MLAHVKAVSFLFNVVSFLASKLMLTDICLCKPVDNLLAKMILATTCKQNKQNSGTFNGKLANFESEPVILCLM